jgi:hypothetical protein
MIGRMSTSRGWVDDIFDDHTPKSIKKANDNNEKIAFNRLSKVLLARWIVFRAFLAVAMEQNAGNLPDDVKRDWLLFQILPLVLIDDEHPFLALMNACLVGVSTEVLEDLLDEFRPTTVLGSAFDPDRDTFFYVLDEAQVAGDLYKGAFADGHATIPRPVLRPIICAWTSSTSPAIKVIVSGTGFSLDLFRTVLTSGTGKDTDSSAWEVVHETGDFINRDTQVSYISLYLPPTFLSSSSGAGLTTRMYEWLRGR